MPLYDESASFYGDKLKKAAPKVARSGFQKNINKLVSFRRTAKLTVRKGFDTVRKGDKRTVTSVRYKIYTDGSAEYTYYFKGGKSYIISRNQSVSSYFGYVGGYVDEPHRTINKNIEKKADKNNKKKGGGSSSSTSNDKEADSGTSSSDSSGGESSSASSGDGYTVNPELAAEYKEYATDRFKEAMMSFGDYQRTIDENGRESFVLDEDGNPVLAKEDYKKYAERTSNVRESMFGGSITKMMKSVQGIHGMPYKFLPTADVPPSKKTDAGRIYKREIMDPTPLLLLTPGVPRFMDDFDDDTKHDVLAAIGYKSEDSSGNAMLDQIIGDNSGMFYSFKFKFGQYYDYVNTILNAMANLLGIGEYKYNGTPLNRYHWQHFANKVTKGLISTHQSVPFYIDANTQATESFSNATGECQLAEQVNNVSTYAKELQFVIGGTGGAKFNEMIQNGLDKALTGLTNVLSSFDKILPTKVVHKILGGFGTLTTGGKLLFPEIWQDSNFTKSQDVSMRFVSPSGDPVSIYLNVLVPLIHLICLAAPRQLNGNGYQSPYIIRAWYKGMFSTDLGIIESLSVKRGDKGKWNKDGLPTVVEVDLTIKDLYGMLSISKRDSLLGTDLIQNPLLLSYMATMCGINSYKPDIMRTWELYKTAIQNIPSDFINRIFDKGLEGLSNLFDIQNPDFLSTLTFEGYLALKNGFSPNKKHKDKNGKDVYDKVNPNLPGSYDGVKIDKNLPPDEQVKLIANGLMNYKIGRNKLDVYDKIDTSAKEANLGVYKDKLNVTPLKIDTPDQFKNKYKNATNAAYNEYVKRATNEYKERVKKMQKQKENAIKNLKPGQKLEFGMTGPRNTRPWYTPTGYPGYYNEYGKWRNDIPPLKKGEKDPYYPSGFRDHL